MQWETVSEEDGQRTEVLEVPRRGCLVRVAILDKKKWQPGPMTWCPGVRLADFQDAPADADPPSPEAPAAEAPDPATPPPDDSPAPTASAKAKPKPKVKGKRVREPRDLTELIREYVTLQEAVLYAFRAKVDVTSGQLGFLENCPQVGGISVEDHGDWAYRINQDSVVLTSRGRMVEVLLPTHQKDNAFDPERLAGYLGSVGQQAVLHGGAEHSVDEATTRRLVERLVKDGVLRSYRAQPRPSYMLK